MTATFYCAHCGRTHIGMITDWAFALPDDVFALSPEARNGRSDFNSDFCVLDEKRFFVRCVLEIPFQVGLGTFGWGVWVELSSGDYLHYARNFEHDLRTVPPVKGILANAMAPYPDTLGRKVLIQYGDSETRPDVRVSEAAGSLFRVQRDSITNADYHDILICLTR